MMTVNGLYDLVIASQDKRVLRNLRVLFLKVGIKEGIYSDKSESKANMSPVPHCPASLVKRQGYAENATQFVSETQADVCWTEECGKVLYSLDEK